MEMSLEKYSGLNFYTWKEKIQMQLMNTSFWRVVKATEATPANTNKLIKYKIVHAHIIKTRSKTYDMFLETKVVIMYADSMDLEYACKAFKEMPE
jgi:hypothetical protein